MTGIVKLSKRVILLLLLAIALLSVALRYPLVEHERYQADSYYIHLLSKSIVEEHRAVWMLEFTSFLGYYPVSYPSGVPMVLAELSDLTGLNIETCILIMGMFVGVALALGAFAVARRFINNTALCLLSSLVVTISPRIVDSSYWVGSARTPLVLMIVLLFIAVTGLFGWSARRNTYIFLIFAIGFACLAVHHMAILILVFAVTYLLAELFVAVLNKVGRRRSNFRLAAYAFLLAVSFGLTVTGIVKISQGPFEADIGSGGFFKSNILGINTLYRLASSYSQQMSIGLAAAVLGIVLQLRKTHLSPATMFIPLMIPAFIPIVGNSLYLSMLLMPFIAVVIAMGYRWMFRLKPFPKLWRTLVVILLVGSLMFPSFMISHWNSEKYVTGDTVVASEDAIHAGLYERYSIGDVPFIWNNEVLANQVSAYSTGVAVHSGVPAIIAGLVNPDTVRAAKEENQWPQVMYQRYIWRGEGAIGDHLIFMMTGEGIDTQSPDFYHYTGNRTNFMCMVDERIPYNFTNTYSVLPSKLTRQIGDGTGQYVDSCIIYTDERISWYAVSIWPSKRV